MGGDDTIAVCPECDSSRLYRRSPRYRPDGDDRPAHRCIECGSEFDNPEHRPSRADSEPQPRTGLAATLYDDYGPEDIGGGSA